MESLGYESNKLLGEVKEEKAKDAIYDFFSDKNQADVTLLFYYSGHGVSDFDGNTYLASSDIILTNQVEEAFRLKYFQKGWKGKNASQPKWL